MEQDNYHSEHGLNSELTPNEQTAPQNSRPIDSEGYYVDYRPDYVNDSINNEYTDNRYDNQSFYYNDASYNNSSSSASKPGNQYGATSMILGIIGLVTVLSGCCSIISIFFGIAGLILGLLAKEEDGRKGAKAIAGIVMSILTILLFIGMIAVYSFMILPEFNNTSTGLQI